MKFVFYTCSLIMCLLPMIKAGVLPRKSLIDDPEMRRMIGNAAHAFYLGKFTELLDTVFFVLRKKYNQISFLHVYHHTSVIFGTWLTAKYGLSHSCVWGAFMNAAVHVVMYFYYFMAALGPKYEKYLWWKKYMTTFQIVQFVTGFIHQTLSLVYTKGEHSMVGIAYCYFFTIVFFSLFVNFYLKNYKKKSGKVHNDENGKDH